MKKYSFIYIVIALICFSSCKKEQIPVYSSPDFIQFASDVTDTVTVSFFFHPNADQVEVALPMQLIGFMPAKDIKYNIEVDSKATTALPSYYQLPSGFVYGEGKVSDTARIIIKKDPAMATQSFLLVLNIVESGDVFPGQLTKITRVISMNDMVSQPSWWDALMVRSYLGVYTELKYRKFMEVTGIGNLSLYDMSQQRVYMLQFKYYLMDMKVAGTPVLEADGTDMLSTIPLIG